jgi:hypothetical protein
MVDQFTVVSDMLEARRKGESVDVIWGRLGLEQLGFVDRSILLYEFCYTGEIDLVKFLIERGVELDFDSYIAVTQDVGREGRVLTYWEDSIHPGSTPIGQAILGTADGVAWNMPVLDKLLGAGADPNRHTYSGYTPLQLAIVCDLPEMAGLLLLRGGDPSKPSTDFDNPTAFDFLDEHTWARYMLERWRKGRNYRTSV